MNTLLEMALLCAETKIKTAWGGYPHGPLIVYLCPTELCNFRCKMCTIGRPGTIDRTEELETGRILSLLAELQKCGTKILALWGGEPLTTTGLIPIIETARSLGIHTYLTTNGYLLDAEWRRMLMAAGVDTISVSLDHTAAEGHDNLRGKPGALDRIVANLRASTYESKGRMNIGINMLVNKDNIDEILKMARLANEIGLKWLKFNPALPGYPFNDMRFDDPDMRFSPDDVARFGQAVEEARKLLLQSGMYTNSRPFLQGMVKHFAGQNLSKGCRAGFLSANISSRGDVTICTRDNRILGNIKNMPFLEVWNSAPFQNARRHPNREACRHCWQSCYAEASYRLNLSFHIKNLGTSLQELGFTNLAQKKK
ncbi:MAG: radical SAM protein [Deltaproteobacteria bacterium]|nr:radical SAM protein [Deltaproteobacteria bacterium]